MFSMFTKSGSSGGENAAEASIGHFDHVYNAVLIGHADGVLPAQVPAKYSQDVIDELGDGERIIKVDLRMYAMEFSETIGVTMADMRDRKLLTVQYSTVAELHWDHSTSSMKLVSYGPDGAKGEPGTKAWAAVRVANSLELEQELRLRFRGLVKNAGQGVRMPLFQYVGMYAGSVKPKPFQRKRANLSFRSQGKLPTLTTMRDQALKSHLGSGRPVASSCSRRIALAFEHVHKGQNWFPLKSVRGDSGVGGQANLLRVDAIGIMVFASTSPEPPLASQALLAVPFEDVALWKVVDKAHKGDDKNGIDLNTTDGQRHFFVCPEVRLLMYTFQHFWNTYREQCDLPLYPRSTHGRAVTTVSTILGEDAPPPEPEGSLELLDSDGSPLRPGAARAGADASASAGERRRSTVTALMGGGPKPVTVNRAVTNHWESVCMHQGWLLKKGGMAKQWLKRYAALYKTSQGHFLCYYSDVADSPLYNTKQNLERNVIDLSKATFIRPVTNSPEAPKHAFDICTIEREWTLCAESHDDMQQWLQMLTLCIDLDTAIVPDDELEFVVKTRIDSTDKLTKHDYTTALKVSHAGVSVCVMRGADEYDEQFFWCYTDFFKWSLLHHMGKTALNITVFTTNDFDTRGKLEFLFRTREGPRLATAIEFYIEKFMATMHLHLETEDDMAAGSVAQRKRSVGDGGNMGMDNNAEDYESDDGGVDLLGGLALDDAAAAPAAETAAPAPPSFDPFSAGAAKAPAPAPAPASDPFGAPAPAPAPAAYADPFALPAAPPAPAAAADPFGMGGAGVAPPGAPIQLDAASAQQMRGFCTTLLSTPQGVLLKTQTLQIMINQEYRGSQARVMFAYRNAGVLEMTDFTASIPAAGDALRTQLSPAPPSIGPMQQQQQQLMLECMQPFDHQPVLNVTFKVNGQAHHFKVDLPIAITKFLERVPMAPSDFGQRWAALVYEDTQALNLPVPTTAAALQATLQAKLQLQIIPGADAGGQAVCAAGALRTGMTNAKGDKISVGCLLRIDVSPMGQLKLTSRTASPAVSKRLGDLVLRLLSFA